MIAVLLIDPKFPHNVGGALRACHLFGAGNLWWTGDRVEQPTEGTLKAGRRFPREERMRGYRNVRFERIPDERIVPQGARRVFTPVAIERREHAEVLPHFVHPVNALYVFGPEDGTLGGPTLSWCHRFVSIPTIPDGPLNLAAAVNVVLYDRFIKNFTRVAAP